MLFLAKLLFEHMEVSLFLAKRKSSASRKESKRDRKMKRRPLDKSGVRSGEVWGRQEVKRRCREILAILEVYGDGVTRFEEGLADGIADEVAFRVDSMDIEGKVGGKDVKNGSRVNGIDVGENGGDGGAESDLLEERIRVEAWEGREGDGRGGRA